MPRKKGLVRHDLSHGEVSAGPLAASAYLEATKRFFSMIKALEIKGILVDGERACALTRYELQAPGGPVFESHVAEVFEVRDDKIKSLDIYFDSAPFPK